MIFGVAEARVRDDRAVVPAREFSYVGYRHSTLLLLVEVGRFAALVPDDVAVRRQHRRRPAGVDGSTLL